MPENALDTAPSARKRLSSTQLPESQGPVDHRLRSTEKSDQQPRGERSASAGTRGSPRDPEHAARPPPRQVLDRETFFFGGLVRLEPQVTTRFFWRMVRNYANSESRT